MVSQATKAAIANKTRFTEKFLARNSFAENIGAKRNPSCLSHYDPFRRLLPSQIPESANTAGASQFFLVCLGCIEFEVSEVISGFR